MVYEYEKGMDEISGIGGTYERGCRTMVKAGLVMTWQRRSMQYAELILVRLLKKTTLKTD